MSALKVSASHQLEIEVIDHLVKAKGSSYLLGRLNELRAKHGDDPKSWETVPVARKEDILINELIEKLKGSYKLCYPHEELCHCRMIPTESVVQAIKQGCETTSDVSRSTKAGTGCGTCSVNTQMILNQLLRK